MKNLTETEVSPAVIEQRVFNRLSPEARQQILKQSWEVRALANLGTQRLELGTPTHETMLLSSIYRFCASLVDHINAKPWLRFWRKQVQTNRQLLDIAPTYSKGDDYKKGLREAVTIGTISANLLEALLGIQPSEHK